MNPVDYTKLNQRQKKTIRDQYVALHNLRLQHKDFFGNVWIKADKDVREYPIGTKFKALMGGHWIRTERGFKWCTGATFPNVGGDWSGEVCLP